MVIFLPTNIGGDGVKVYYLKKSNADNSLGSVVSYVFVERFIGFASILLTWLVYMLIYAKTYAYLTKKLISIVDFNQKKAIVFLIAMFVILAAVFYALFRRRSVLKVRLKKFWLDFRNKLKDITKKQYGYATVYSFLFHFFRGLAFYFGLKYLGADIEPVHIILLLFMTTFIGFIPISIGALGTLEAAIVLSLVIFGISEEVALALALYYRLVIILFSLIGGMIYLTYKKIN